MAGSSSQSPTKKSLTVQEIFKAKSPLEKLLLLAPDSCRKIRFVEKYSEQFGLQESIQRCDCGSLTKDRITGIAADMGGISLFYTKRFFLFSNIENFPTALNEPFIELLKLASPQEIILCTGKKLPTTSVLHKFFSKEKAVLSLDTPEGFELKRWIGKECSRYECQITEPAIDILIMGSEGNLDVLAKQCELLALYGEKGATIDHNTVKDVLPSIGLDNEFQLIEDICSGNIKRATQQLHTISVNNHASPFGLVALLFRNLALLTEIHSNISLGLSESAIRTKLDLSPWIFNKLIPIAKKSRKESLTNALAACMKVDSLLKNRSLKAEDLFHEVLYETAR